MTTLIYNVKMWLWNPNESKISSKPNFSPIITGEKSWIVIKDGKIIQIESDSNLNLDLKAFDTVVNGNGCLLLPGLIDAHIHVALTGESQYFLDLSSCDSIEQLKMSLFNHSRQHPDLVNIQGVNWDQDKLGRYPSRFDLDEICQDKPVMLWRACWHIVVVNTRALELCGIDLSGQSILSIDGGIIDIINDGEHSIVTGILRERAVESVVSVFSSNSFEIKKHFILEGLALCSKMGLTSVQTNDEASYNVYKSLRDEGSLNIRVFLTPTYSDLMLSADKNGIHEIKPFNYMYRRISNHMEIDNDPITYNDSVTYFNMDRIKIFADGSLGAETAAIRVLDSDDNDNKSDKSYKGVLVHSEGSLCEMMTKSKLLGYRLEM